ncbi:hypothetical protein [Pseudobdellovibrio sp. HCB154]|uniref:hypothetical protein n=1 Tax=Pseudobdellovibrio sp. HCB154 TaxID=3386277 RepID=UPI00391758F6
MRAVLLTLTFLTLVSCSYSHTSGGHDQASPQAGLSDPKPGEEPAVRYADVNSAVFASSCSGCHQKKGLDLSFADYANSKSFANEIFVRVFEDQDMPPRGGLTELQLQVLRTWIENGSPE